MAGYARLSGAEATALEAREELLLRDRDAVSERHDAESVLRAACLPERARFPRGSGSPQDQCFTWNIGRSCFT